MMGKIVVERRANREELPGGNEQMGRVSASLAADINAIETVIGLGGGIAGYAAVTKLLSKLYKDWEDRSNIEKVANMYLVELKMHQKRWKEHGSSFSDLELNEFLKTVSSLRDDCKVTLKQAAGVPKAEDTLIYVVEKCDALREDVKDAIKSKQGKTPEEVRSHVLSKMFDVHRALRHTDLAESSAYAIKEEA